MPKYLEVVELKSGEKGTIVEVYDSTTYMVEIVRPNNRSELRDVTINDIKT
jgi:hypothetical protein